MSELKEFYQLGKTYLESNACGRWDGALKADTHKRLCELFVSKRLNISTDKASRLKVGDEWLCDLVRVSTLSLTDYLDEEIDFPLNKAPNYKRLTPAFTGKFIKLATDWFDEQTCLMSDDDLKEILKGITKNSMGFMFPSLDSYGFEFVSGEAEKGKDMFLTMKSKIGQVVTIKPNNFFGCNYNLDTPLT